MLPPSAVGDYLSSCQKITSLIWHGGKGGTLKKIAHIYTSIKATSVLRFGGSTVVSGDKLLETVQALSAQSPVQSLNQLTHKADDHHQPATGWMQHLNLMEQVEKYFPFASFW